MTGSDPRGHAAARPDRRAALAGLARCVGGAATLLAGMAGVGQAAPVPADDARLRTANVRQTVAPGQTLALYMALPARGRGRHPAVMIAHDARGLDEQARAVARQVALEGYVACAPDFLSRLGGTPADGEAARIMIATLDPAGSLADAVATAQWLGRNPPGERVLTGRVASLGLGWGGGIVERMAVDAAPPLVAGVVYGAPAPAMAAPPAVPLLRHAAGRAYAGGTGSAVDRGEPLRAGAPAVEAYDYDGVDPAPGGDMAAAALAWQRTASFLRRVLA